MNRASGRKPLYQIIFDEILDEIVSGALGNGEKIKTEAELAAAYNVSRITVTRAVKDLERRGLVIRIPGKGTFVNRKDTSAKSREPSPSSRARLIALILPFGHDVQKYDLFAEDEAQRSLEFLQGAESECERHGFFITFHDSHYDPAEESALIHQIMERGFEGAIVYPQSSFHNLEAFQTMAVKRFPFVLIDRYIPALPTSAVYVDGERGIWRVVSHLVSLGHRSIAYVGAESAETAALIDRFRGFLRSMTYHGLSVQPQHVCQWFPSDRQMLSDRSVADRHELRLEASRLLLKQLTKASPRVTAVVAVSDMIASHLCIAAEQLGISVPHELSITGFDNRPLTQTVPVPLTTMRYSFRTEAAVAARLLLRQIESGKPDLQARKLIYPTLVERASTAAPR